MLMKDQDQKSFDTEVCDKLPQPHSQGLSLPAAWVLVGHVPPVQIKTLGRIALRSSILLHWHLSISKQGYHSHTLTSIKRTMLYSSLQATVSNSIYSNINF